MNTYLWKEDLNSLRHLANISENQVIDVYENGTVSTPYKSGTLGSVWRTGRWITGYGQNRNDIPKIKQLMQRVLVSYLVEGESLKKPIEESVNGLNILKEHYKKKQCIGISQEIQNIINFVEENLYSISQTIDHTLKNERFKNIAKLDASMISPSSSGMEGVKNYHEGLNYFIDRINDFLILEKHLGDEDQNFLRDLKQSLQNTHFETEGSEFYSEVNLRMVSMNQQDPLDDKNKLEYITLFNQQCAELKAEKIQALLNSLDTINPLKAEQIGITVPMLTVWEDEKLGHVYFISLCKNQNGTFTAAQVNAGTLALADNLQINFHLNFNFPCSIGFSSVVEFPSLNKLEAFDLLVRAERHQKSYTKSREEAQTTYNKIFAPLFNKKTSERIPPRRGQIVGNCGVRSLKELLIYNFQKANKIELANKFLTYIDSRTKDTLPFELVKPLF